MRIAQGSARSTGPYIARSRTADVRSYSPEHRFRPAASPIRDHRRGSL